jgi:redox-sensitive bicupin YhaK (pirin superfamily)
MKASREVLYVTYAHEFQMGPMRVKQPLPARGVDQLSPFLLLHHAGPTELQAEGSHGRISPHPHRGFEPVTFIFQGEVYHRDSMGNEGYLKGGDVQWMTAGSGVIHSEGPSEEFLKKGGVLEIIQLWINLPKSAKMMTPRYQDIKKESFPVIEDEDGNVHIQLVSGELAGKKGAADTQSPILSAMVEMKKGGSYFFEIPSHFNASLYILKGELSFGKGKSESELHYVIFGRGNDGVFVNAESDARFLLLAGEPIQEPVVSYGPFVMNTKEEIQQAILDYENGKMGDLDF